MNAASISKIINKAGIKKQTVYRSKMVKGYAEFSEGYVATTGYEAKCIVINYEAGSKARAFNSDDFIASKRSAFETIASLMTSKGYDVEGDADAYRLIIREKAAA